MMITMVMMMMIMVMIMMVIVMTMMIMMMMMIMVMMMTTMMILICQASMPDKNLLHPLKSQEVLTVNVKGLAEQQMRY